MTVAFPGSDDSAKKNDDGPVMKHSNSPLNAVGTLPKTFNGTVVAGCSPCGSVVVTYARPFAHEIVDSANGSGEPTTAPYQIAVPSIATKFR